MRKPLGQGQQAPDALQQSEERFRLLVAHALDAVITIDLQGLITSWNPQAERLFGWPQEARAVLVGWQELAGGQ